jgi:hypothetical protein
MPSAALVRFLPIVLVFAIVPLPVRAAAHADVVTDWNFAIENQFTSAALRQRPLFVQARTLAMVHLAMCHAIRAVDPRATAAQQLAGAIAAHDVLAALHPEETSVFDALLARQRADIPSGKETDRAVALGASAAARVLAAREADGLARALEVAAAPVEALPARPTFPGEDEPALVGGVDTGWRLVAPFTLKNAKQFRAQAPFGLDSEDRIGGVASFKVGGIFTSEPDDEDPVRVARFWDESAALRWNHIARILADRDKLPLDVRARLFATLNVALADACIAGSESRAYFATWRRAVGTFFVKEPDFPTSQQFVTDGTLFPAHDISTISDPDEDTPVFLPPVPDYPPLPAVEAGAAATVLISFFKRDAIEFVVEDAPENDRDEKSVSARAFRSVSDAAREAAIAPTFVGRHFAEGCVAGYRQGRDVSRWIVKRTANGSRW